MAHMKDWIVKIPFLPDLSMPKYRARHGDSCVPRARNALYGVLELLEADQDEWLALRYRISPSAPSQDRLKIFVKLMQSDKEDIAEQAKSGIHRITEFYACDKSSVAEAAGSLTDGSHSIFLLQKDEEMLANPQKDLFYYAVVPFLGGQPGNMDPVDLDSLFDGLKAPCLVDIVLKPTEMSSSVRFGLLEEIQYLDQLASAFQPERLDAGSLADLAKSKDLVAARQRDYYQKYFDAMFSGRVYEFTIRVLSHDRAEGSLVARYLGTTISPGGRFRIEERDSSHAKYGEMLAAIRNFDYVADTFPLPGNHLCRSERLSNRAPQLMKTLEKRVLRAAGLSHLRALVNPELASRMAQLPTSCGVYFETIRIESELYGTTDNSHGVEKDIEVGLEAERPGRATVGLDQLQKHGFITGVTGSGKTTTILNVLMELWNRHRIPFLVFEPAKSEYRSLIQTKGNIAKDLRIFTPGNESLSPFRFNPLEVPADLPIEEHISMLEMCFAGAIPMSGSLPSLISEAIEEAYQTAGFKLSDIADGDSALWPTMKDLVRAANRIMAARGYEGEVRANLQTAIDVRLKSLCRRSVGRMFSFERSSPAVNDLLKHPTILELERLNLDQQNLLVLFLLTSIRERLSKLGPSKDLRHVIVIEEAHNLVGRPGSSGQISEDFADPRGHATRFLVKLLAEVRALGEGILIIDQSPSSVSPDVLKNTSVKIVHRSVSEDDRDALAAAMLLDGYAHEELARLRTGEAFFYNEHLYRPIRILAHNPLSGRESLDDAKVKKLLGASSWYMEAQKERFLHFKETLDQIIQDMKGRIISLIKKVQSRPLRGKYRSLHNQFITMAKKARSQIDEAVAAARLDLGDAVIPEAKACQKRLKDILGEVEWILKEEKKFREEKK